MSKLDDLITVFRDYSIERNLPVFMMGSEEVKKDIKALFLELIGPDEEPGRTMGGPGMPSFQRDTLRRELRKEVREL